MTELSPTANRCQKPATLRAGFVRDAKRMGGVEPDQVCVCFGTGAAPLRCPLPSSCTTQCLSRVPVCVPPTG